MGRLIAFLSICLFPGLQAPALAQSQYMLCKRDAYSSVVGKTISKTKDVCDASAKIQTISYECGTADESYDFRTRAIETNRKDAQNACDSFCSDLDSKCRGRLTYSSGCGFSVPFEREMPVGREIIQCPDRCKGKAFHYCSSYHGSFFGFEPSLFAKVPDNCSCYR